jgi:hypothetical protein
MVFCVLMAVESGADGMVPSATVSVRLMLTLQFAMPLAEPSPLTNLKPIFGPSRQ